MNEFDFEGELGRALADDCGDVEMADAWQDWPATLSALRRAYAAGVQASGGGSDMDRLVTIAAGMVSGPAFESLLMQIKDAESMKVALDTIAASASQLLSALKAQAVAK